MSTTTLRRLGATAGLAVIVTGTAALTVRAVRSHQSPAAVATIARTAAPCLVPAISAEDPYPDSEHLGDLTTDDWPVPAQRSPHRTPAYWLRTTRAA